MRDNVVIVAAVRTAIGNFGGSLSDLPAHTLGAIVISDLIKRAGIKPKLVDEVIFGQVLTSGVGQNPARQSAIAGGLPNSVPCMTINKVCGSGLKTVHLAAQAIKCGDADIIIAGGQESMSLSPHILPKSRNGTKMGDWKMQDSMIIDGLWDAFNNYHMGTTAENIAKKYKISRREQDEFAATSQLKTETAINSAKFDDEIVPVKIPQRKGEPIIFDKDEFPRANVTVERLAKMLPVFDEEGTVTAANASGLNDGAAGVLVMSESKAKILGLEPLATIKAYSNAGVDPKIMGTGPIPASKRCLEKANWTVEDLDLIESNEAFAAQAITVNRELGWDTSKVNVNGGAISLGHPIGAVSLLHEMKRRNAKKGLATLCIGGGLGVALAVERK